MRDILLLLLFGLLLPGCGALPTQADRAPESAFSDSEATTLGKHANAATQRHAGQSGVLILNTGHQAFLQRVTLIEAAERSIDAQYYIWNSDVSGTYLARRLLLAAERGVRVRLLLDDINVAGRDAVFAALSSHRNIEVRIYNPFAARAGLGKWLGFIADFQRLNRRMHNKTFVVDGAFGIVGGRNIGDEYFDVHPQINFRDRDVLAAGPIVRDMSANFDAYWNSPSSYPIDLLVPDALNGQDLDAQFDQAVAAASDTTGLTQVPPQNAATAHVRTAQTLAELTWSEAELVFDPPAADMREGSDNTSRSAQALRKLVDQSGKEILVESAYFILGDAQLDAFAQIHARGVRVAALTNSLASNDLTTNHAGYARRRPAMLAKGLDLYELRPDAAACTVWIEVPGYCDNGMVSLHAKSAVFDRKTLFIGSFNVNLRSIYLNGETVLIIHSPVLAERVARDIELGMAPDNSWQVSQDAEGRLHWFTGAVEASTHEPDTGIWRRIKSGLFSLLPIEKYL
jgi:putative cardiolipin synthase